jgi:Cytochrome P460
LNQNPHSFVYTFGHNKAKFSLNAQKARNKMMNGFRFVLLGVGTSVLLGSCALFGGGEPNDFDARDNDFAGYEKWALLGTTTGASDQLEMAHDAKNPAVTRYIFIKDDAKRKSDGQFPVGTIIAKQSRLADGTLVGVSTAMVKRAKGFNPTAGNWEWFMLEPKTGTIIKNPQGEVQRGKISMCITCHTDAEGTDFSFLAK